MNKQVFQQDVGIVAGGDFVQTGNVIHMAAPAPEQPKPILDSQRTYLNQLVKKIIELRPDTPAWQIWKTVHREVGANSIDEMSIAQYPEAVNCLNRIMDGYDEEAQCRLMVSRVMAIVGREGEAYQSAVGYCIEHYGKKRFIDLKKDQLRELLAALPAMMPEEDIHECDHDCESCRAMTAAAHRVEISRIKVATTNEVGGLKARNQELEKELRAFKNKVSGELKQRETALEKSFYSRVERLRQWWITGCILSLTVGIVFGGWLF